MNRFIALGAALALLSPIKAHAVNWVLVAQGSAGSAAWVDTDTITRGKDYYGVWYRLALEKGEWAIALAAIRCPSKSYMDLKMVHYERNGSSTSLDQILKKEWDMPIPGSVMDGLIDEVCKGAW